MDDWKSNSELLRDLAEWKTPQKAEQGRKKNGLIGLCILLSGVAAAILAGATGSGQVFWLAWIVFSAISVGMVPK